MPGVGKAKIKKRLRDTQRLLRKPQLSATKKADAERALAALTLQLHEADQANREKTLAARYNMVRFFELKKAKRRLKKNPDDPQAQADYQYVASFPRDAKYESIYAKDASGRHHEHMKAVRLCLATRGGRGSS